MRVPPYVAKPVTIERLERGMVVLAYLMVRDGDVHAPMYERLECELAEMKRKAATLERARQLLASETGIAILATLNAS
jgi:hypothetical protein